MDRNETLADIVGVMRRERFHCNGIPVPSVERIVRGYADRIEAAAKREAPFRYTAKLIGIVYEMRVAFEKILAIEGYGAPWIEAQTIAQKALEIALPDRRYAQNPESLSNTAKIREALEEIIDALNEARTEGRIEHWEYSNLFDIADAALAAPPRNCDVGTVKEQTKRFWRFCNEKTCEECQCPLPSIKGGACELFWGQMPYEAAQEGGDK